MIRIEPEAWAEMLAHATKTYPAECCGAMLGRRESGAKRITRARALENVFPGPRNTRYEVNPQELIETERLARRDGLDLIGIYHSHPDRDAYFSQEDLRNSCPWYSYVVLSIRAGQFDHAKSWLPDAEQTKAEPEELFYPAAAGVGRIGLVDFDVVDLTNLQRQVILGSSDVGRKKLDSAVETLREINPALRLDLFDTALSSENALEISKDI